MKRGIQVDVPQHAQDRLDELTVLRDAALDAAKSTFRLNTAKAGFAATPPSPMPASRAWGHFAPSMEEVIEGENYPSATDVESVNRGLYPRFHGFTSAVSKRFHAVSLRFHRGFTRFHWDGFMASELTE
jgi:hypothetical protein